MVNPPIIFGVIPARGGSSGLPGKNIKLLNGHPLITYIIRAALGSHLIDRLFVSTEDDSIESIAVDNGSEVIKHAPALSSDSASTFGVISHAASYFNEYSSPPDIIVTMRATSPLCKSDDITRAIELLLTTPKTDSVVSVVRSDVHPYRVLRIDDDNMLERFDERSPEAYFPMQRQSFEAVYVRNGAIYATKSSVIKSGSLWGRNIMPYIMPKERSININDEVDFRIAEMLLRA